MTAVGSGSSGSGSGRVSQELTGLQIEQLGVLPSGRHQLLVGVNARHRDAPRTSCTPGPSVIAESW